MKKTCGIANKRNARDADRTLNPQPGCYRPISKEAESFDVQNERIDAAQHGWPYDNLTLNQAVSSWASTVIGRLARKSDS
jgi:hypothetical protein